MSTDECGIFLNGSYGVGKTSTLDHLADLFADAELPFSLFDVDWFHRSWPTAATDPHNTVIESENIRAVWDNYRRAGWRTPIIAGVITNTEDRERYEHCFGIPLRIIHLTADSVVAERRLRGRYSMSQSPALNWHLDDHQRLARDLQKIVFHDLVIETDHLTSAEVARLVFDAFAPSSLP